MEATMLTIVWPRPRQDECVHCSGNPLVHQRLPRMQTIAECIEDETTLEILRDIGMEWGQGYYFGKPVLAEDK